MSRRVPPDRAAQNQQTVKNLLKLEANKICADCKRNKHPRWASWNLGVFICIRCSGIHRGMGTHISRVKSVDLDSWTDEQLQNVIKWGNARANKYWEAKLAPGHIPSEAKIENFIRTKYELKRWVMDGPMPDPSTLGNDDDTPLAVVQEKAKLERSASQRTAPSAPSTAQRQQQQSVNLFDDDVVSPQERPSTTGPTPVSRPPPSTTEQAPKQPAKQSDTLLGLDFFGNTQSTPTSRPSSTTPTSGNQRMSRPDLKQSILSLYATAPKPQPQQHERTSSIGDTATSQSQSSSNLGGLTDAFSGLSFSPAPSSPPASKPQNQTSDIFASLAGLANPKPPSTTTPAASATSATSGGDGLFDSIAFNKPAPKPASSRNTSISSSANGFNVPAKPTSPVLTKSTPSASDDLFDLAAPAVTTTTSPPAPKTTSPLAEPTITSAFNLSSTSSTTRPAPATEPAATTSTSTTNIGNVLSSVSIDPWASDPWRTPDPAPVTTEAPGSSVSATMKMPEKLTSNDIGAGWGAPSKPTTQPEVTADEDFGGWTSAAPTSTSAGGSSTIKPLSGFAGNDDLFSNVWE
ncbi:hypothetical protein VTN49DRAFT_83 [Thermomyces lanuginosus]|uniref:uncharacterized protein n=1 Tax=Thermomyces lanuginosus TaxID=5541 RepID=UPI003742666D